MSVFEYDILQRQKIEERALDKLLCSAPPGSSIDLNDDLDQAVEEQPTIQLTERKIVHYTQQKPPEPEPNKKRKEPPKLPQEVPKRPSYPKPQVAPPIAPPKPKQVFFNSRGEKLVADRAHVPQESSSATAPKKEGRYHVEKHGNKTVVFPRY